MKKASQLLFLGWFILSLSYTQGQTSIGGFNVYYGHLHNHSNVSGGTNNPDAAYNYARNTGQLDFFSLADHSRDIDASEWTSMKAAAEKYNLAGVFTTFCGFEWSGYELGDVSVINSANYITIDSPTNSIAGLCNWLNNNECVAFFNHPGRNNSTGLEFNNFTSAVSEKLVGMELWNRDDRFPVYYYTDGYYPDDGNKSWFDEALSRGWKIGAAGSEDNHSGTWGTATTSRLAVLAAANNRTEIYNALKARRFFTTYDKNMRLSFQIDGHEMGSTISASTLQFTILASDGDGEVFTQVNLLKNGSVVQTWTPHTSAVSISGTMTFAKGDYYYIRVKQADNDEAISSPIWVSSINQSPTASISSPLHNTLLIAPASIAMTAAANDTGGNIQKVEFYQGSTLLGEDSTFPYSCQWSNVPVGVYLLTAKAIDDQGAFGVSSAIQVSVYNSGGQITSSSVIATAMDDLEESSTGDFSNILNSSDIELVDDTGTSPANQVVGLRFNNLNIPQGAVVSHAYVQFTCDEISSNPCNLIISGEAANSSAAFSTTAFNLSGRIKTTAQVSWSPAGWATVGESGNIQQSPDISAIVQEIVSRPGYVSTGAISLIITGTGARIAESFEGSPTQAAKMYVQYSLKKANKFPMVSIASPINETVFISPARIHLTSTASDTDGSVAKVEYFNATTLLGAGAGTGYDFTWNNVPAGNYLITARATDNEGAVTQSAAIHVVVSLPNQAPGVAITGPAEGTEYTAPAAITIQADATDQDGSVTKVDFYEGANRIGSDNSFPYSFTWNNVPKGIYSFSAVATDGKSATATSAAISAIVNAAPVMKIFSTRIAMGSDDVEESEKGVMSIGSDDIELIYDDKISGNQLVGLRFNAVTIPKDAVIISAYIKFTADEKINGLCNLTIKGENTGHSATFSASSKVSTRSQTSSSVNWVPAEWLTVGLSASGQLTPNLKSIVQEIVSHSAWVSGNSLAFIVTGTGNGKRTAVSYESSLKKAALLRIEYLAPPGLKVDRIVAASAETIESFKSEAELECYPMPFSDILNVELKFAENDRITSVEVFNSNGAMVKSVRASGVKEQVQLPGLPSGIYFIRVKTFGKTFQKKIVKN